MGNRILILGGAGFIGINLSLILKSQGYCVTVIDTLENGYIFSTKLFELNEIKFIQHTVLDPEFMLETVKKYDYVVNLVSSKIVDDGFFVQESLSQTYLLSTQILMQAASHGEVKKIILASNLHVYGEPKPFRSKCKENSSKTNPVCPLGSLKLSEEIIATTLAKAYDQPLVIARISECYGAYMKTHMPYSSAMMSMIVANKCDMACTLPNDGKDTRDWIFVEDVCWYLSELLTTPSSKSLIETYNISSGNVKSFRDVYNDICNINEREPKVIEKIVSYPFVGHLQADNTKLTTKFGNHFTDYSQGLKICVDWANQNLEDQKKLIPSSTSTDSADA